MRPKDLESPLVITNLIEWCPKCDCQRGVIEIRDDPNEDCNASEAIKVYRIVQRTAEARTCDCGAKLTLHVEHGAATPTHPLKRKKPIRTTSLTVSSPSITC